MKQFLYVFLVVAAIAVAALIAYFLYYRAVGPVSPEGQTGALPGAPTQSGQTQTIPTGRPGAENPSAAQKLNAVAQNPVMNFYVDGQGAAILVQPDGQVVKVAAGNSSVLSSVSIPNLIGASFSFDGSKILVSFGGRANPQTSVFDVGSKSWQPLAQNLQSAAWSPNDYRLVYLADKNGARVLTVFDPMNVKTKPTELATLRINDAALNWISANKIIISDKGSALWAGSAWIFDVKAKTLSPLAVNKPGLQSAWSDVAGMGLVFGARAGGFGGVAELADITTGQTINVLSFLTLPSKCLFEAQTRNATATTNVATSSKPVKTAPPAAAPIIKRTLYCAVPRDAEALNASALPDDYLKKAIFTADDFYKTDLATGATSAVFADASRNLDADNLKIFNKTLFFVNRFDQMLYGISL